MNSDVLLIDFPDQRLVALPFELIDTVASTNIRAKLYEGLVRSIGNRVRSGRIARNFNCYRSLIDVGTRYAVYANRISILIGPSSAPGTILSSTYVAIFPSFPIP